MNKKILIGAVASVAAIGTLGYFGLTTGVSAVYVDATTGKVIDTQSQRVSRFDNDVTIAATSFSHYQATNKIVVKIPVNKRVTFKLYPKTYVTGINLINHQQISLAESLGDKLEAEAIEQKKAVVQSLSAVVGYTGQEASGTYYFANTSNGRVALAMSLSGVPNQTMLTEYQSTAIKSAATPILMFKSASAQVGRQSTVTTRAQLTADLSDSKVTGYVFGADGVMYQKKTAAGKVDTLFGTKSGRETVNGSNWQPATAKQQNIYQQLLAENGGVKVTVEALSTANLPKSATLNDATTAMVMALAEKTKTTLNADSKVAVAMDNGRYRVSVDGTPIGSYFYKSGDQQGVIMTGDNLSDADQNTLISVGEYYRRYQANNKAVFNKIVAQISFS
jgi:hypothetical protein